ncbi:MAG: DUF5309 family protein [Spirochaetia bacterium]|jgi:hypothetical protein|nr:DUF5309 family protein [Spirochaetia bacterium]
MANVAAGTLWNLPNYAGQLFTPSKIKTPFLDMITMAGTVNSPEFAMSSSYDMESAAQPAITETGSLTAPSAVSYVRANEKNVAQIFQRQIALSYAKMSDAGRLARVEVSTSGVAYDEFGNNPVNDELAFQIQTNMDQLKMDLEYSLLNGAYALSTASSVAYKTRGLITGSTTNTVAAGTVDITSTIMDSLFKEMADNGAFDQEGRFIVACNAWNMQMLGKAYEFVPTDRFIGGSAINSIVTQFGQFDIVYVPRVPITTIAVINMSKVGVMFQPVTGKPVNEDKVIVEPLAKTGAGELWQLYTQIGVDYGSSYFHGTVTGTTSS